MKILKRNTKVGRFQEGGAMPAPEAAPAEAPQGGDPMEQVYQMAAEIVQQLGPDAAAMLAQAIMEMLQGGAGAPAAPQGEPVYKKGGKLIGRMR
jgi:hypothetical protein